MGPSALRVAGIVKAIAERMRGGVGFESLLGGGALFYIDVPM
jgi:signal transduction histidine kinase